MSEPTEPMSAANRILDELCLPSGNYTAQHLRRDARIVAQALAERGALPAAEPTSAAKEAAEKIVKLYWEKYGVLSYGSDSAKIINQALAEWDSQIAMDTECIERIRNHGMKLEQQLKERERAYCTAVRIRDGEILELKQQLKERDEELRITKIGLQSAVDAANRLTEELRLARERLCSIGLYPPVHDTLPKAVEAAVRMVATLRETIHNPPSDVQQSVIAKLDLVSRDALTSRDQQIADLTSGKERLIECLKSLREEFAGQILQFDDGDIDASDYISEAIDAAKKEERK